MDEFQDVKKFSNELDAISPSMCFAKWKQVTLHLQTGHNHSCHHPKTHKTPIEELKQDPSALHNTEFKKSQRALMLKGQRPAECDYCWRVEDSSPNKQVLSDRYTKSYEPWAQDYRDEIVKTGTGNINPSYLEVSFSNVCNFKCSYCAPEISSKWMEEIKQHGAYPTSTRFNNLENVEKQNKMPIPHKDPNPYVDAFWEWWPELYKDLRVFRITGGEPLMTKNTFKVLDYVIENPNPKISININSNLCVPKDILDKFIEKVKRIQGENMIAQFQLYTSNEAKGSRAEYIRHGLDYNQWLDNCRRILSEIPKSKLTNMATYNALSVTSFQEFMQDWLQLRKEFMSGPERRNPVSLDVAYLRWPWHQNIHILPKSYRQMIESQVTWMYQNKEVGDWPPLCGNGWYDHEINRMKRIYFVAKQGPDQSFDVEQAKKDFVKFVDEHDRRRGTNFLKTFPEMTAFYHEVKDAI
jgi:organic radical activating enzyme